MAVLPSNTNWFVSLQATAGSSGTAALSPIVNTAWLTDVGTGLGTRATLMVNARSFYLPVTAAEQ
jgi:hypothetical protein